MSGIPQHTHIDLVLEAGEDAEYIRLHQRFPDEPLLLLCIAVAQMQQVMSRSNKKRDQSVLLGVAQCLSELSKHPPGKRWLQTDRGQEILDMVTQNATAPVAKTLCLTATLNSRSSSTGSLGPIFKALVSRGAGYLRSDLSSEK